jgi:HicB-like protein involved in pilus formation
MPRASAITGAIGGSSGCDIAGAITRLERMRIAMGPDDEVQDAERRFGGRVLVRMPASLHRELVMAAEADNQGNIA